MLFLGMLLVIVGVQFFSVGLLGEMLVHQTQNEREYVVKERN
jgi:small neutral amino acid transporter SnatA (MarC family)